MRRHHLVFIVDLGWVAISAILAVLIRDNFILYPRHVSASVAYTLITVAASALVFGVVGTHKILWRYISLPDALRIVAAVTFALLLGLFLTFVTSRTEGVARSVPLIQWLILVMMMIGTRIGARLWDERRRRSAVTIHSGGRAEHILVVGVSHLTELFLQSVAEYASKSVDVVGILSDDKDLRGRSLGFQKVLGTPEELSKVMAQLEVHGIAIDRIVVAQPIEQLSPPTREALLHLERESAVRVDWMVEFLAFGGVPRDVRTSTAPASADGPAILQMGQTITQPGFADGRVKRAFDLFFAMALTVLLSPVLVLTGLLVAIDVGFPLIFWQKRPGKHGRPFKLFKFRTMHPAHDINGDRIPDDRRSTRLGHLLRKTRLDELPQLYNIITGEMSFVGPRPLLPADQPTETRSRLLVRPGLTGLAQAYGMRSMSPEDKNALDLCYARNASLWLDLKILLRTMIVVLRGERIDHHTLLAARDGLQFPR